MTEIEEDSTDNIDNTENFVTVSELTELIKNVLKVNFDKTIHVIGEVSNYKLSKNNIFFTLKDEESTISVAMWNYNVKKDKVVFQNGSKIKVYGKITVYSKSGTYNLTAYRIELLGVGDLYQEYMTLKKQYLDLGYFDETKKKQLPTIINKVGIITAQDGAALQDFLYVLKKNNYCGEVYIKNSIVQGKDCPKNIVDNLKELDQMNFDVIVVARGGGSFEDLFGFSHKDVIDTIHNMKTCTVSAIGHEIDFMLSDFVADIRAPTPSIAGEIISSKKETIYDQVEIEAMSHRLRNILNTRLTLLTYEVASIKPNSPGDIMNKFSYNIESLKMGIINTINNKINHLDSELNNLTLIFNKVDNPTEILSKGYCLVYSKTNLKGPQNIIKIETLEQFKELEPKKLKIKFLDGYAIVELKNINPQYGK
ncbi:exodeoxyribonuclease VII large subunit [Klosneuvirus KNV1]|uniref:Exodeoxyribonuclease VII large subunit n=1 Tax=Klosneuvirus KNV1 TaxID=1977640 RepID=A0A1V0SIT1_9VIRU|nr:exodeoxyribonuclease VII large subunit [Klosneuvirus KNV1]